MFKEPVVFVDIETTGGSNKNNRIIELAAIKYVDGEVVEEFHSLINPGMHLPEWISKLTGIRDVDLVGAPYFEDVAEGISRLFNESIFIAHNVRFDFSFIKRQLEGCGYKFNPKLLCTVRLSRALYPQHRSHKLESVIQRHGLVVDNRHRAYADTKALLDFCQLAFLEHGELKFQSAINRQLKRPSLPPNLPSDSVSSISNNPGVYIFEDAEGKPLYVGKSINLRKRVMSHFSQDCRSEKEMKLSLGVHSIKTIETDNELNALLLESRLVKDMLPLHNRKLRRVKKYVALLKATNPAGYSTISASPVDLEASQDLSSIYGLYETRSKAQAALLRHQKTFSICSKLLGLEKGSGACFQYQLHRCAGACIGKESPDKHNLRIELALERTKIEAWPYKGPILVVDKNNPGTTLVVDQWRIIGEVVDSQVQTGKYDDNFDLDTYRILRSFIYGKSTQLKITPLKSLHQLT